MCQKTLSRNFGISYEKDIIWYLQGSDRLMERIYVKSKQCVEAQFVTTLGDCDQTGTATPRLPCMLAFMAHIFSNVQEMGKAHGAAFLSDAVRGRFPSPIIHQDSARS